MSNFKQGYPEGSTTRPAAQIQMCEAWLCAGQGDLPDRHNIRAAMHVAWYASQRLEGCPGWGRERAALVVLWKIAEACVEFLEEQEREGRLIASLAFFRAWQAGPGRDAYDRAMAAGKGESEAREYATAAEPRLAELYYLSEPR